jgi:hypothetical protein
LKSNNLSNHQESSSWQLGSPLPSSSRQRIGIIAKEDVDKRRYVTSRNGGFYDYNYNCVSSRTGHVRLEQQFPVRSHCGRVVSDRVVVWDRGDVLHWLADLALAGISVLCGSGFADWDVGCMTHVQLRVGLVC